MRFLVYPEKKEIIKFLKAARREAEKATCLRARCGSVIVKDRKIIGRGFNSPPANDEGQRRCLCDKKGLHAKVTDKTCCVHAEQRAIMDALSHYPDKIKGSRLYFMRLDASKGLVFAGAPYCTICSKMALDSGVKEFVLMHEKVTAVYDTREYNLLSYRFNGNRE